MAQLPLTFASYAAAEYQRGRNLKLSERRLKDSLPYVFRELSDGTITWKYDLAGMRRFDRARLNPWQDIRMVGCPVLVFARQPLAGCA